MLTNQRAQFQTRVVTLLNFKYRIVYRLIPSSRKQDLKRKKLQKDFFEFKFNVASVKATPHTNYKTQKERKKERKEKERKKERKKGERKKERRKKERKKERRKKGEKRKK